MGTHIRGKISWREKFIIWGRIREINEIKRRTKVKTCPYNRGEGKIEITKKETIKCSSCSKTKIKEMKYFINFADYYNTIYRTIEYFLDYSFS